ATADPGRPWWSFTTTLAVSILLGADAIWSRRPFLVYVSGLLVSVAGYLIWHSWLISEWEGWGELPWPRDDWADTSWQPHQLPRFLYLQVACLGTASACWSLLELKLRRLREPIDLRGRWVPFVDAAALAALHLLALLILAGLVGDVMGTAIHVGG